MVQEIGIDQVEQLWYTWSTTGLDKQDLAAGFRVRAASPGLTDLYGERMKQLDRYLRYSLPPGADPLRTRPFNPQDVRIQEDAPICLAFVRTESGERALVHKVYAGKDGRGRPGAYFAHLLAELPTDFFTARDAIRLWRLFSFWRTSDVSEQTKGTILSDVPLDRRAYALVNAPYQVPVPIMSLQLQSNTPIINAQSNRLTLPKIPFENAQALSKKFIGVDFDEANINSEDVYGHLCFVIQAYLLRQKAIEDQKIECDKLSQEVEEYRTQIETGKQPRSEIKRLKLLREEKEGLLHLLMRREPPRIFIAAPPDEVAYLIAGLTRLLPRLFLKDLTFSTYEDNVLTKLPLDIVGTCKPLILLDRADDECDILPDICYQRGFVLNTYHPEKNTLFPPSLTSAGRDPRYVEEHARFVRKCEEYANFVVDELRDVMFNTNVHDRQEEYYTPISSIQTPIKEIDDLFQELGDTLDKSLDELPLTNISALVDIPIGQLSLLEIARILQDPSEAAHRLKTRRFRQQIFIRDYHDSKRDPVIRDNKETREQHLAWLRDALPSLLSNLRQGSPDMNVRTNIAPANEIHEMLDILAKEAAEGIYQALLHKDIERFEILFIPLKHLEPTSLRRPEPMSEIWMKLLSQCCESAQLQNFIKENSDVHDRLLEIAIEVREPNHSDSLFLLKVEAILFGKLLHFLQEQEPDRFGRHLASQQGQTTKALEWLHQATLCFLDKGKPSPNSAIRGALLYDKGTILQLENDFAPFKTLIASLLSGSNGKPNQSPSTEWRATAQKFLLALVNSGFEHQSIYRDQYKMDLMRIWLDTANNYQGGLPDFPFDRVPFSVTELEHLLQAYGPTLQQQDNAHTIVVPLFRRLVVMKSQQKMQVLFQLLDQPVSRESFAHLLDIQAFNDYITSNATQLQHLMRPYETHSLQGIHLMTAQEYHTFQLRYSNDYKNEAHLILIKQRPVQEISGLLKNYTHRHSDEVCSRLASFSDQFQAALYQMPLEYTQNHAMEVYGMLMQHSARFVKEIYKVAETFLRQNSDEVHTILPKLPNYASGVYTLPLRSSSSHIRQVHTLLMSNEPYQTKVLERLIKYVKQYNNEVHDLLTRYSIEYKNIINTLIERFTNINAEKLHSTLIDHSEQYTKEVYNLPNAQPFVPADRRPQYLLLYPDARIWQQMITRFQEEKHPGRIPLLYAIIQARLELKNGPIIDRMALDNYVKMAKLSGNEYASFVRRFGPNLLAIPELAPLIAQYYNNMPECRNDFALLLYLLDQNPAIAIANELLKSTPFNGNRAMRYSSRYGQSNPQFCYRLAQSVLDQLYSSLEKLDEWYVLFPSIPIWLRRGMSDEELAQTLGRATFPLNELDGSIVEEHGQRYLIQSRHSKVFLTLSEYYLQTFDIKIFERTQGKAFLQFLYEDERRYIIADFPDLVNLIDGWYETLQFIEQPTLQQDDRLTNIFAFVHQEVSQDRKQDWIELIACALATCIEYAGLLGVIYTLINKISRNDIATYMEAMAKHIKEKIRVSGNSSAEKWQYWRQRAAVLVESLVLPGLSSALPEETKKGIIYILLNTDAVLRSSIDEDAAFWSPTARGAALKYGINPKARPAKSAAIVPSQPEIPVAPIPSERASVPTSSSTNQPITETSNVSVVVKRTKFFSVRLLSLRLSFMSVKKFISLWLIFPLLRFRLGWLCRGSGTGKLARFWLTHNEVLPIAAPLMSDRLNARLKFACDFYNVCWETDNDPGSEEAHQKLLSIVKSNLSYYPTLTAHEQRRVRIAEVRTGEDLPSLEPKEGWWSWFVGWWSRFMRWLFSPITSFIRWLNTPIDESHQQQPSSNTTNTPTQSRGSRNGKGGKQS